MRPNDRFTSFVVTIVALFIAPIVSAQTLYGLQPVAPTITRQPTPQNVREGFRAKYAVRARGSFAMQFQWQRLGLDGNFFDIPGATGSYYSFPVNRALDDGAIFRVIVWNVAGEAISDPTTLIVRDVLPGRSAGPPRITREPTNQNVREDFRAKFSVRVIGKRPLVYQWQRAGADGIFTDIPGANGSYYSTPISFAADNNAQFRAVVTNELGSVTSTAATLVVRERLAGSSGGPPLITRNPTNQNVRQGFRAKFAVRSRGQRPLTYQWQRAGTGGAFTDIPGANGSYYSFPVNPQADNNTQFRAVVTNSLGSATSLPATLVIRETLPGRSAGPPLITRNPTNQNVRDGFRAKFAVRTRGQRPLTYQWQRAGADGVFTDIPGADGSYYSFPVVPSRDNNTSFRVVVTNTLGTATSNSATLVIRPRTGIGTGPGPNPGTSPIQFASFDTSAGFGASVRVVATSAVTGRLEAFDSAGNPLFVDDLTLQVGQEFVADIDSRGVATSGVVRLTIASGTVNAELRSETSTTLRVEGLRPSQTGTLQFGSSCTSGTVLVVNASGQSSTTTVRVRSSSAVFVDESFQSLPFGMRGFPTGAGRFVDVTSTLPFVAFERCGS